MRFTNFADFPLIICVQKPMILDFMVMLMGCRPSSPYNMYIGVLFLHFVIVRKNWF